MSDQRVDYRPQINYTSDYYSTAAGDTRSIDIMISSQGVTKPLDTVTIPSIEENINYLDTAIGFLPTSLSRALREVYEPVRDIFYDELIDKIVDLNLRPPEIIIIPATAPGLPDIVGPDRPSTDTEDRTVHPIVLRPINFHDPTDPNPPVVDPTPEDKTIHPIILRPIPSSDSDDGDGDMKTVYPIILKPIPNSGGSDDDPDDGGGGGGPDDGGGDDSDGGGPGDDDFDGGDDPDINYPDDRPSGGGDVPEGEERPGGDPSFPGTDDDDDSYDEEGNDDEDRLWDPPATEVIEKTIDLYDMIDKEFVYLTSKIVHNYTTKLKDIVNNYYYNGLRSAINQGKENNEFIANNLKLTSNDIVNHSKHLFDSSIKNEDAARLRVNFFANVFNIKESLTHIQSFFLAHELRKRYTNIDYSVGGSRANSFSDFSLQQMNLRYENQYRKSFENLFRYLESSMRVTEDILRLYIQNRENKSTLLRKGGIK